LAVFFVLSPGMARKLDSVALLERQAERLAKTENLQEMRARMLYDAAWGARTLADAEVASTRAVPPSTSLLPDVSLVPVLSEEMSCDAPCWRSS
jgi:hypothetical protein